MTTPENASFADLSLSAPILKALADVGYETPSPIQAASIPALLEGNDILGMAQTGTGKTAAFALPMLNKVDISKKHPQVLVLAPTRELAIQVAEAFQAYARHMPGFHVLPIYGGQGIDIQLKHLRRGAHVVVGTPGRVMDHLRRKSLSLEKLDSFVLDEADEMLRMGFIEDVEWILEHAPEQRQVALFSATMPTAIKKVTQKYLNNPTEIKIKAKTSTVENIEQRYIQVTPRYKLDALTRILESEPFDGVIMFARTKTATVELAEKLEARGYSASALNGDMSQQLRERTIDNLKKNKIEIVIATDVAARGIDVSRVTHVINYDMPHDTESYVHRIGRTGRAGRKGTAILFSSPRERRMLQMIERATKQPLKEMALPCAETIANKRAEQFKQQITDTMESTDLAFFAQLIEQYTQENDVSAHEAAAALAYLCQKDRPLQYKEEIPAPREFKDRGQRGARGDRPARGERPPRGERPRRQQSDVDMVTYRIEVGREQGVTPRDIVGAIANEAGLDGEHIGHIEIDQEFSLVDLPAGMPRDIFMDLKKVRVCGRPMKISMLGEHEKPPAKSRKHAKAKTKPRTKPKAKPKAKKRLGS